MTISVVLFIPNLLGYLRILLAFVGLHYSDSRPIQSICIWVFSASLDLVDGILARRLNQTSSFGVLLDIAADNILRSVIWVAASASDPKTFQLVACILISLEWTTMVCTQLHASQSGTYWKTVRDKAPWLIRALFETNFKSPIGIWCVYGLFSAGLFAYASSHIQVVEKIPFFHILKYSAFGGRAMSVLAEVWLSLEYLSLVVEKDTNDKRM